MREDHIGIIGLGYVGLPLAVEFGKKFKTLGFDVNSSRIDELKSGIDITLETESSDIESAKKLSFSSDTNSLQDPNIYIVTVPTPIDDSKNPDLSFLENACLTIAPFLKAKDIVVFESTVFPGATEEICVPILEQRSGLKFNCDFFCGYSPERINPGDKNHKLTSIVKVVSGSTPEIADRLCILYEQIITAGVHRASSIRVAEAAKIIENTQRDINIALMNELSLIFKKMNIDTQEVLQAAKTKWNFLDFNPGLVGGHCIGVDPYYLTYKAKEVGHHPEIILAGRKINDEMANIIADEVIEFANQKAILPQLSNVLVMGMTFKQDCPDIRNTKVVDLIRRMESRGMKVDIYDPWVDRDEASSEYSIEMIDEIEDGKYQIIILAVPHRKFLEMGIDKIRGFGDQNSFIYDVRYLFPSNLVDRSI